MADKKPHHHGDLREALISAGLELIEIDGVDGLTLRKCAAKAGVSHAAPAHHFNGLISLKVAIIARGYQKFADTMQSAMDAATSDSKTQLSAICAGYLEFARGQVGLFQFMFQNHDEDVSNVNPWSMDSLNAASARAYGLLQQACAPFDTLKGIENSTEVTVWSLVHGYAMLFQAGEGQGTPSGPLPNFDAILSGLNLTEKP